MSHREAADGQRWETVERWKKLEVEQAQAQHANCLLVAEQAQAQIDRVLDRIREAHAFARQQSLTGQTLSPEALQRAIRYTVMQDGDLREARKAFSAAQAEVEEARLQLLEKLTQMSVIQRLRERRVAQSSLEFIRREQRRLDDDAVLKLTTDTHSKVSGEASWQ